MKRRKFEDIWTQITVGSEADCWEWNGRTNTGGGYGIIGVCGMEYLVHRVAYALTHGNAIGYSAPKDKSVRQFVLHKCDNRICCNPAHLFLGNYADNIADMKAKGRAKPGRNGGQKPGIHNYQSKLTMKQADEIRWLSRFWLSAGEIADLYGIGRSTMARVVQNKVYRGL